MFENGRDLIFAIPQKCSVVESMIFDCMCSSVIHYGGVVVGISYGGVSCQRMMRDRLYNEMIFFSVHRSTYVGW